MHNRIKILCLAGVLAIAGISFSIGDANARYVNETTKTLLYESDEHYLWEFLEADRQITVTAASIPVITEQDTDINTDIESNPGQDTETDPTEGETTETDSTETVSAMIETVDGTVTVKGYPGNDGVTWLELALPTDCDSAVLGYNGGSFPAGTVYSQDGVYGKRLSGGGGISLTAQEAKALVLQMPAGGTLDVYYYAQGTLTKREEEQIDLQSDQEPGWGAVLNREPVMAAGDTMTWTIQGGDTGASYGVELEYLREAGYADILSVAEYPLTLSQKEENGVVTITLSNPDSKYALPGTYRMKIHYQQALADGGTIQMETLQIPFFVSYR